MDVSDSNPRHRRKGAGGIRGEKKAKIGVDDDVLLRKLALEESKWVRQAKEIEG